ncbi:MAG: MarC family protein [Pseudomonadota bacterium]|jgi:multiple antibiotic resistance protein|nr:MarC family protein [Pseudomonadota bacterium]
MDVLFSTFVVLLIVIDPIGNAPIFMALTHNMEAAYRRKMAIRSITLATAILLIFLLIGDPLLATLGIGISAFRISGGILLFLLAIDMVFARQSGLRSTTAQEQYEAEHKRDVSVFPLAFPLIAGPGALTTVLLMTSPRPAFWTFVGMLVALLLVLGLALMSLLLAERIMHWLGETGANVITRLLGLILAALAVQYILDGIGNAFV